MLGDRALIEKYLIGDVLINPTSATNLSNIIPFYDAPHNLPMKLCIKVPR